MLRTITSRSRFVVLRRQPTSWAPAPRRAFADNAVAVEQASARAPAPLSAKELATSNTAKMKAKQKKKGASRSQWAKRLDDQASRKAEDVSRAAKKKEWRLENKGKKKKGAKGGGSDGGKKKRPAGFK